MPAQAAPGCQKSALVYNPAQYITPVQAPCASVSSPEFSALVLMKHARIAIFCKLLWLVLVSMMGTGAAHADSHADVLHLLEAQKFDQALTQVDDYLAKQPADPPMRFFKSIIQSHSGQTAQAIATLTRLSEDYPELPEPYNNLAVLYASQGQLEKARSALLMALRNNPGYATAHENLGDVSIRLARQAYSQALQLNAGNASLSHKLMLLDDVIKPGSRPTNPDLQPIADH